MTCSMWSLYRYVLGTQDKSTAAAASKSVSSGVGLWNFFFTDIFDLFKIFVVLFQVDLLKNQKADKVDVTIQPEELEVMDDVLAAK
jgi:hypothetical protein